MSAAYRIFTICQSAINDVAEVGYQKTDKGIVPAITVGFESGMGALPVHLPARQYRKWRQERVFICSASINAEAERLELVWNHGEQTDSTKAIVVLRTTLFSYVENIHTGRQTGWKCRDCGYLEEDSTYIDRCSICYKIGSFLPDYGEFPGQVLCRGTLARGSGEQLIALVSQNEVFRMARLSLDTGRVMGQEFIYRWDGTSIDHRVKLNSM